MTQSIIFNLKIVVDTGGVHISNKNSSLCEIDGVAVMKHRGIAA